MLVPLNTRLAGPELRYALEDSGASVLVTDRESVTQTLGVPAMLAASAECSDISPEVLIEHCHQRIARYKAPKGGEISAEPLPKSGAGKVLKRELRAPFREHVGRGVN